ncbi:MAG: hypothetical protein JKY65_13555, partial [Planctomycetes bacterium]|nr:hypothetical protein [Planctomycetota bacterium]
EAADEAADEADDGADDGAIGAPVSDDPAPGPAKAEAEGVHDVLDSLDLSRGEVDDRDVNGLLDAIDALDFATRRATEERLVQLRGLHARLGDVIDQISRGERAARPEAEPLTKEQEARYEGAVDRGLAAGRARDLDSAVKALQEAVQIYPEGIDGLFNLGVVYGMVAHKNITTAEFYDDYTRDSIYVEKARICYDHVLDLEPNHLPSLNNLATLYSMRENRDAAIGYLERILATEPSTDVERHLMAEARDQLKELL